MPPRIEATKRMGVQPNFNLDPPSDRDTMFFQDRCSGSRLCCQKTTWLPLGFAVMIATGAAVSNRGRADDPGTSTESGATATVSAEPPATNPPNDASQADRDSGQNDEGSKPAQDTKDTKPAAKDTKSATEGAGSGKKTVGYEPDPNERFDLSVREDLFAGFEGDEEALKRGMKKCDEALAKNPNHAEALVWRGAGKMAVAAAAFQKNDFGKGMKYWTESIDEMNRAKKLAPGNIAVMIPRAAVMVNAGRNAPAIMGRPLLQAVREDFEATYESQKEFLDQLGDHPLGELRMGLADIYRLMGEREKSEAQLRAVQRELPDTPYAERAGQWLVAKPDAKLAHQCIGCHDG